MEGAQAPPSSGTGKEPPPLDHSMSSSPASTGKAGHGHPATHSGQACEKVAGMLFTRFIKTDSIGFPPFIKRGVSARPLLLRAASKVGRAAQMNPRIQGITSQPIKIPILMLEDGDVICAGDIPPPLSFDEEARRPLARMVPGVDPLNDPAGQVSNLLSPEVNNDRDSSSLPTGLGQHFGTLWCLGRRWRTLPPVHRVWIRSPPPRRERGGGGLRLRELQEISPRVKPGGGIRRTEGVAEGGAPPQKQKKYLRGKEKS